MPKSKHAINSDLPPSGTRCTDVLADIIQGYAGIHKVEFDLDNDNLALTYDPNTLNDRHAMAIVQRAGEQALERVYSCPQKNDLNCHTCLKALRTIAPNNNHHPDQLESAVHFNYQGGVMEINLNGSVAMNSTLSRVVNKVFPSPQIATFPPSLPTLNRERVEVAFTSINALATLTAFLGERFGFLPPSLILALFVIAYIAGGYFGLLDGIDVLRRRRLDVNLLMIMAALGAAAIGQPLEGAILLFLFSLSNTLQTYAMDRSRKAIKK
ncbi:MAG: hypothetical protein IBX69_16935, partial [Anaerolineales bacterium]|nr:hypothetical protein [Anaerolineales bacterium]